MLTASCTLDDVHTASTLHHGATDPLCCLQSVAPSDIGHVSVFVINGSSFCYNNGYGNVGCYNVGNNNIGDRNNGDFNVGNNNNGTGNTVSISISTTYDSYVKHQLQIDYMLTLWLQGNFNQGMNNTGEFNTGVTICCLWQLCRECMIQLLTLWRFTGMYNNGTGNDGTFNLGVNNTGNFNRGISNDGDANQGELVHAPL